MWPRGNKLITLLVSNIASKHTHKHRRRVLGNCTGQSGFNGPPPQFTWVTIAALPSVKVLRVLTKIHTQLHIHTHSESCIVFSWCSQCCSNQCNTTSALYIHGEGPGFIYDPLTLWSSSISQLKQLVCFPSAPTLSHSSPASRTNTNDLSFLR